MTITTSTVPNAVDNPKLFDVLTLGGVSSPGVVKLSGHDRKIDWDIKVGNAQAGATTTKKGVPPVEFTATFSLVKDITNGIDDFTDWEAFQKLIDSTTDGPTPKALTIYHPDLSRNKIKSVVKSSVGGLVHDGKGGATVAVKFLEYFPPKKTGGSPKAGERAAALAGDLDPLKEKKALVAKLTNINDNTPWGSSTPAMNGGQGPAPLATKLAGAAFGS